MTLLKSIVVCLALANVGYFLWSRGIAHPLADAAPAPASSLKLASEGGSQPRSAAAGAADDGAAGAGSILGASGGVAASGGAPASSSIGTADWSSTSP